MFSHLQFQKANIRSKSTAGETALTQLDLNDDESIAFRLLMLGMIELAEEKKLQLGAAIQSVASRRDAG